LVEEKSVINLPSKAENRRESSVTLITVDTVVLATRRKNSCKILRKVYFWEPDLIWTNL